MRERPLEQRTITAMLRDGAEHHGDAPYLLFSENTYTYADAERITREYADGFSARGVQQRSNVAVMMDNCPEYVWSAFALGRMGAVCVPINTAAKGQLLHHYLVEANCQHLLVDAAYLPLIEATLGGLERFGLIVVRDGGVAEAPAGAIDFAQLQASGREAPGGGEAAVAFHDPWCIMFTSGTTGPSKGVVCPHAQTHGVGRRLAGAWDLDSSDRLYTFLPLFHANALWYSCLTAMWADASVALAPRFSASNFWSDVHRFGATEFNAMMSVTNILQKLEPTELERDNPLRLGFVVPLPKDREAVEERWGLKLTHCFAMTELGPSAVLIPGTGYDKPSPAGTLDPGYIDMQVVDELDRPVAPGTPGELVARTVEPWNTMLGYYERPEATTEALRNQWFHTGDRGVIDEDGYVYFQDRIKDVIRRRGENISAQEIERILQQDGRILECAAVPVASKLGEDEVGLYLARSEAGATLTEAEVVALAVAELPYFMVPRFVMFLDQLPRTDTFKIAKYKLRDRAVAEREQLWDREAHGIVVRR